MGRFWNFRNDEREPEDGVLDVRGVLLKAAGVRVFGWGPDDYEQDTGIHHIACTCEWWQR